MAAKLPYFVLHFTVCFYDSGDICERRKDADPRESVSAKAQKRGKVKFCSHAQRGDGCKEELNAETVEVD